jgi:hypothetical protein
MKTASSKLAGAQRNYLNWGDKAILVLVQDLEGFPELFIAIAILQAGVVNFQIEILLKYS